MIKISIDSRNAIVAELENGKKEYPEEGKNHITKIEAVEAVNALYSSPVWGLETIIEDTLWYING